MLIKITVENGVVIDVETSEPALVQIVVADRDETSTFETLAQAVELGPYDLDDSAADALLNQEVMSDPLHTFSLWEESLMQTQIDYYWRWVKPIVRL